MDWFRSRHDLDDERILIGVTAGLLWLVAALTGAFAQLMPGAPSVNPWLFGGLVIGVGAYGAVSISGWIDWTKVSVTGHARVTAIVVPFLALPLWATGGPDSYILPILVLPLLHVAYFFRWRVSLFLAAELMLVAASPSLYETSVRDGAASRLVAFAIIAGVVVLTLQALKSRLVAAEAHQRSMAERDPLTGLLNRRAFDDVLHAAVAARGETSSGRRAADDRPGFALLLFDLDRFKAVNDSQGHPAGDRLLRAVAAGCTRIVREGDTLARIGGDEFAVIAPGAGVNGAERLADELGQAIRGTGIEATVAWAVHPEDGMSGEALLREADRRLYEGKAALA
jgi:diguanylate cyclase (GGDEF)-like protein